MLLVRRGLATAVCGNTGKTSFLASEVSHMAHQLADDEKIIWFCNEEKGSRIKLRLYNAVLDEPNTRILSNLELAQIKFDRRGGNKIKIIDNVTHISTIRELCFEYRPRLIIIDQGDKVDFPGSKSFEGPARLKEIYWRYRQLANEFNIACLTVGQASAEGAGKKWLELHHMDNSKTGKPGELDFAIGIGKLLDDSEDNIRYINLCKNKLTGKHTKHTVKFKDTNARYEDI